MIVVSTVLGRALVGLARKLSMALGCWLAPGGAELAVEGGDQPRVDAKEVSLFSSWERSTRVTSKTTRASTGACRCSKYRNVSSSHSPQSDGYAKKRRALDRSAMDSDTLNHFILSSNRTAITWMRLFIGFSGAAIC